MILIIVPCFWPTKAAAQKEGSSVPLPLCIPPTQSPTTVTNLFVSYVCVCDM